MEKILIILASILLGAFANRWRGGGFPNHTLMDDFGVPGNLTLYFIMSGFWIPSAGWNLQIALMGIPAMAIGASFGWGGYVGACFDGKIFRKGDTPRMDRIITSLEDKPFLWGMAGLSLRGLLWSFLLVTPFFYASFFGSIDYSWWRLLIMLLTGSLMGPVYFCTGWLFRRFDLAPGSGWFSRWGWAEMIWGAILWGFFAAAGTV